MSDRSSVSQFWQSVALRLIVIWLFGWALVWWFHGCLIPATRNELRDDHQKTLPADLPAR